MRKVIEENHLVFTELFSAKPHVFLQKDYPLASKKVVSIHDLAPYPRLNFVQGEYESVYFSEELFSSIPVDKEISELEKSYLEKLRKYAPVNS